ncbi:MAG: transketolase [Chlamydiia bacterium]|nr:transketolase [Chlamydiia bacterium]
MDSFDKTLSVEQKKIFNKIANTVRHLSMDAVQKANSGHPGLPLGCAELGAYLYGLALHHFPKKSQWINRDRMILSAGHGSMWLYSLLHLSGFNLSLEEIKEFRQLGSKTPGHPEYGHTDGVEATTGPLGQGVGNAVGIALGLKMLATKFNTSDHSIFDSKVFCLASDGDIMEGVSGEASSFGGHLKLDNLVVIYDANDITLDGPLLESASEDTVARYRAYGWEVYEIDGYDLEHLHEIFFDLRNSQTQPVLIKAKTLIGKGAPNVAGTSKAHGAPLGPDEVETAKANLGLPAEEFYIPKSVKAYFEEKLNKDKQQYEAWLETFRKWSKANPSLFEEFEAMREKTLPDDLEKKITSIEMKSPLAGRKASQVVLEVLSELMPSLYGGSADLSGSDMTMMKKYPIISPGRFEGRNIKYGEREFAMGTIANGLALTTMIIPFVGTFLTFSDYMRNAIRLAALSRLQVIYQFTHDSIFLGEDGPTHQPIEHYAALRAMPNLLVIRPADNNEVKMAWVAALMHKTGPTALILSRQVLPQLSQTEVPYDKGLGRGGYIVRSEKIQPDFTLFATGSELQLALGVSDELAKMGKDVRVISMPCWELFEQQDPAYKDAVIGGDLGKRVSIEAGSELGWHKYIGLNGTAISMDTFGASAPAGALAEEFGFQTDLILERILSEYTQTI